MAIQTLPGSVFFPSFVYGNSFIHATNLLIDASGEKAAFVFIAPRTGTIDTIEFRVGTVAINASSVVRVSLQNVSGTDGFPDGTQDQYRDVAGSAISSNSWIAPGLLTDDGTDTGAKRSVTLGDVLAVVIEYQTFTASDSVIVSNWTTINTGILGIPYCSLFTSSWANVNNDPCFALKYNDGIYYSVSPNVAPWKTINTTAFNSSSTPDERGLIFSLPFPVVLRGAIVQMNTSGAGRDFTVKLYDTDGSTVLASRAHDADIRHAAASRTFQFPLPEVSLSANSNYRLTVLPTTTSSVSIYDADVESAAHLNAVAGGANWHYTHRTDAGAWTETTTKRPFIGLWLSGFDDGTGGGGGGGILSGSLTGGRQL